MSGSEKFYVEALGETPDGRLLVNLFNEIFVLEQNRLELFGKSAVGNVFAFYDDDNGGLWIGGTDGVSYLKDGATTVLTEKDGLAANDVKIIIGDRAGGIWAGSYGGLTHLKNSKIEKWTESEGLPTPTIRSLYLDSDGSLWIGSYDSGLARFKDGKFTHYTTRTGLFNDGAFQILEDERRNFWISSNRGIYRVNKDELNEFAEGRRNSITSIAYGKSDGMLNVECNGGRSPGGIKARDGGGSGFRRRTASR